MRDAILHAVARLVLRFPLAVVLGAVALAAMSGVYAARNLRMNADTNDLIARDRPYMKPFVAFMREFGDLEYLYAVVESEGEDQARARAAVEALVARLRALPDIGGVYGEVTPEAQRRLATRAMTDSELSGFAAASGVFTPIMEGRPAGELVRGANESLETLVALGSGMDRAEQERLGASAVFALEAIAGAGAPGSPSAGAVAPLLPGGLPARPLASETGRMHFITIVPSKDYGTLGVIDEPLRLIRGAIDETRAEFPGVPIGLTGKPVLQADEMMTTNADMLRASVIALVGCATVIILMLRGVARPLLAVVALGIAAAWTYGAATLFVGQLNLLSVVFMLVLIGVGMDYGVHVISRFREGRATGELADAVDGAVVYAGRGNLTGAITSSGVFFMALLTSFQGLRELGLIAGTGLLLCVVSMNVVLPALLVVTDPWLKRPLLPPGHDETRFSRRFDAFMHRRAGWVLGLAAAASLAFLLAPGVMRFEKNLLKLQAEGLESVAWERRVQADSSANTWFGAVVVDDESAIEGVVERARQEPTIGAVQSVLDFVRPSTPERRALRESLPGPAEQEASASPVPLDARAVGRAAGLVRQIAAGATVMGAQREAERLGGLRESLLALEARLEKEPEATALAVRLGLEGVGDSLRQILAGNRLGLREALPGAVREQFVSPGGKFLVMLHPKQNVWDYDRMGEFVGAMRRVDPAVTGVPITHFESIGEMQHAFVVMTGLSVAFVCIVLMADFRHLRDAAVCLLPLAIGLLWTIEAMALLGVSFNLANFFAAPILLGLSVDAGVHILHRFKEGGESRLHLGATRRAVILTSLTTMIGFGALVVAHHKGLRSLGIAMALGTAACLVASVIVLPAALALLEKNGDEPAAPGAPPR